MIDERLRHVRRALWLAAWLLACAGASAQQTGSGDDEEEPAPKNRSETKVTLGRYGERGDGGVVGRDLNVRWRRDDSTVWGGVYQDARFGRQVRVGVDTRWKPVRGIDFDILPSVFAASRGFQGGSFAVEIGDPFYVQAGIGRTNAKPYANLNFDPNDALMLSAGWHEDSIGSYSVAAIRDDRFHTGQLHLHVNAQWVTAERERLTVDFLHKSGQGDSGYVMANGLAVTYDWPHWFARIAYDPKQNFGARDVTRLSVGARF